jgi:hypothetical protein
LDTFNVLQGSEIKLLGLDLAQNRKGLAVRLASLDPQAMELPNMGVLDLPHSTIKSWAVL